MILTSTYIDQQSSYLRTNILLYLSWIGSSLDICVLEFSLVKELCLIGLISFIMQEPDKGNPWLFKVLSVFLLQVVV